MGNLTTLISVEFRVFESYEQSLLPIIKEQLEGGKMAVVFLPTKSAVTVMEVFCFLRRALSTFEGKNVSIIAVMLNRRSMYCKVHVCALDLCAYAIVFSFLL